MNILALTTSDYLAIAGMLGAPVLGGIFVKYMWDSITGKHRVKREEAKKLKEDIRLLKQSDQAILRNNLVQEHRTHMIKGEIDYDDKKNFENMYNIYHKLGNNGVMNKMYEDVINLPLSTGEPKYGRRADDK